MASIAIRPRRAVIALFGLAFVAPLALARGNATESHRSTPDFRTSARMPSTVSSPTVRYSTCGGAAGGLSNARSEATTCSGGTKRVSWDGAPETVAQLRKLNLQPLKYTDSAVPVPNYERRPAAPRLQEALDLEESAKHMQFPPGFELTLFASEPMLEGNPEAMAWDERGRLWIADTFL